MLAAGLAASMTSACSDSDPGQADGAVDSGHHHHEDASVADATTVDAQPDAEEPDWDAGIPIYDAVPPRPDQDD